MQTKARVEAMRRQANDSCDVCASRSICLPGGLDKHQCEAVSQQVQWRHSLLRGEHLYRVGDPVRDHLYAVKTGQFKLYDVDESGKTRVIGFRRAGDFLGLDVLGRSHHRISVVALTDAVICEFSHARLVVGALREEALARELNALMSRELAREHSVHLALYERDATNKLSQFLLMQRDEQMRRGESGELLALAMSRADIGHYLSLSGETVSRILTRLQQSGCVTISHRHVMIVDISGLRAVPVAEKAGKSPLALDYRAAGARPYPIAFSRPLPNRARAEAATLALPVRRAQCAKRVPALKIVS